jgi:hypothetical protein
MSLFYFAILGGGLCVSFLRPPAGKSWHTSVLGYRY